MLAHRPATTFDGKPAGFFAPEGMAVSWPFQEQQEPVPGAHVAQNTAAASISAASRMIRS